ncbi:AhpC/TSA family protein, partial [Leptospira bandrabouensis]|nr:AhpC/TSA family protein [Leptospira bandrabouensis]
MKVRVKTATTLSSVSNSMLAINFSKTKKSIDLQGNLRRHTGSMEFLPESFKTREAVGIHLRSKTILPCLPHRLSLLVFLRHSGGIFSREAINDLKEISESGLSFAPVLFFFS